MIVALDPGKTTGFAVRSVAEKTTHLLVVCSLSFWDVHTELSEYWEEGSLEALIIEDTRSQPIYQERRNRLRGQALAKMARSVGGIDRDVTLWEDWAELHDIPAILWPPFRGKWKAADFEAAVGNAHAHARTNQHGRDAARLVLAVSPGDLRIARTVAALPSP